MAPSTKLEDKLEGIENFRAWKYRIGLILQENDLDKYILNLRKQVKLAFTLKFTVIKPGAWDHLVRRSQKIEILENEKLILLGDVLD